MSAVTPTPEREDVVRRLEALGARVRLVTDGNVRRMEPNIDQRILALRARVESRAPGEE